MKLIFGKVLFAALTLFCAILSTGNLAFAGHTHTPPSSGSDSSSSDTGGSTPKVADSQPPPSTVSSDKSGDGSGSNPSGSGGDDSGGSSQGSQGTSPNPPTLPPTKCPDGSTPDKYGNCPIPPPSPVPSCPPDAKVIDGKCVVQGPPFPVKCQSGITVFGLNSKCPSLPKQCHQFNNTTLCVFHNTVIHNRTVKQTQTVATNANEINLLLVTTCTADQNNGVLNGNLAALCDSTITMMHNDGLDTQLPQVDMYLKARGLLQ